MTPDRQRLFRMAQLRCLTFSDNVANLLDRELATGESVADIVHRLHLSAGQCRVTGEGLAHRITLMLAVETLLCFAPETAQALEEAEDVVDGMEMKH